MKRVVINFLLGFMVVFVNAQVPGSPSASNDDEQIKTTVLVVYYSVTGNTEKMAQAIAAGAQKDSSVIVLVKTADKVTDNDLKTAMSAQMKAFIDEL